MADNRYDKMDKIVLELLKKNSGTYLTHTNGNYSLCIGELCIAKKEVVSNLKLPPNCTITLCNNSDFKKAIITYSFAGIEFEIPVLL